MTGGPWADEDEPDADLWHRLRVADEFAFRELFRRHRNAVYNFAFRRTASWSVAEDVTQLTFTALWRRALRGDVDPLRLDSARPVLVAMARGECSNALRTARRQLRLVQSLPLDQVTHPDVDRWVETEVTMQQIRRMVDRLPTGQREVVELVAWSELSMADVALLLGLPVGTVKSRLARARARLVQLGGAALIHDPDPAARERGGLA